MTKQGKFFEDLDVGDTAEMSFPVTEDVVVKFAEVSGDDNPVHLDEAYARTTQFGGRIAHGMLSGSFISTVLGTALPGYGSIYLSQSLHFRRPVKIGDTVVVKVTVTGLDERKGLTTLDTVCSVGGKRVLDGVALIMPPRRGATSS